VYRLWIGILVVTLLPAGAVTQSSKIAFTQFADPSEGAFSVDLPAGWTVAGGMTRVSPIDAQPWVTATAPDGSIQIFIGAQEMVPGFRVPGPGQTEGDQVPAVSPEVPPNIALSFRPGAEFAEYYGPTRLRVAGCDGATATGTKPMPDLAQAQAARAANFTGSITTRYTYTLPQHDAGLATFSCQENGTAIAAGVIADTTEPGAGGSWNMTEVAGYIATPEQAAWAQAILKYMLASMRWNPQWDQGMRLAVQAALTRQYQQDDNAFAELQAMQRQSAVFSQEMFAETGAELSAIHKAQMAQLSAQSAQESATFQQNMYLKGLNTWNWTAHEVRGGALYQDVTTGAIVEVDPY